MVAAADRDVPGGIRSGANSHSATASMRPIVPLRRLRGMCPSPDGRNPALPREGWGRHDEACPRTDPEEDDVTDPGTSDVPDADRAEQEALLDPPAVSLAGDASAPP